MNWTEKEVIFLKENYSKNIRLEEIANHLKRTIKSIKRKAQRERLSRPRFHSNKTHKQTPKKIIDNRYYTKHKEDINKRKRKKIKEIKQELVKILGGKCKLCGYSKCSAALEFHHNKENKTNSITILMGHVSKQKVLKEVKKCILLCANCHREVHTKDV